MIWAVQMSTVEFHPWNSRREDTEKPDEWRIDLDPGPLSDYATVQRVAHVAHEVLDELGAVGFPKTSGGKGCTSTSGSRPTTASRTYAAGRWRSPARSSAAPDDVTTTWWRKDRDPHHLFVDYNQNARDHTIAAAYSVRGFPDARVSTPIRWDEVDDVDPHDFTIFTVPARFAELGDLHADIDDHPFDIAPLLEWADRDEREGKEPPGRPRRVTPEAPWHLGSSSVGIQITPSILNADFADLGAEVARIGSADWVHVDDHGQPLRPEPHVRPDDGRGAGRSRPTCRSTRT